MDANTATTEHTAALPQRGPALPQCGKSAVADSLILIANGQGVTSWLLYLLILAIMAWVAVNLGRCAVYLAMEALCLFERLAGRSGSSNEDMFDRLLEKIARFKDLRQTVDKAAKVRDELIEHLDRLMERKKALMRENEAIELVTLEKERHNQAVAAQVRREEEEAQLARIEAILKTRARYSHLPLTPPTARKPTRPVQAV